MIVGERGRGGRMVGERERGGRWWVRGRGGNDGG